MRRTREEKAITLIALIITIVVLLILAAVAINAVTGDGIIQHAVNAKTEYEKAQAKENGILAYYEQYLNVQSGSGPWKQDGDNVYMTDTEGNKIILRIGDKVEYDEGYDAENLKTTNLDSNFVMKNLEWRVLGINGNGQLELISTQPTDSTFTLGGEDGYLNGPAKLNKICSELYSTELATARSLNVDDIDKLAGIKTEADKRELDENYGSWWKYEYNTTSGKIQYSKSTDYNPGTNAGTWTTPQDTNNERFKEPGKEEINSGNTTGVSKIKYSVCTYRVTSKISASTKTSDGISISDLLLGLNSENNAVDNSGNTITQWLASNMVWVNIEKTETAEDTAFFGLNYLESQYGRKAAHYLWSATGTIYEVSFVIRPIVTLKSRVQIVDTDNNGIPNVK